MATDHASDNCPVCDVLRQNAAAGENPDGVEKNHKAIKHIKNENEIFHAVQNAQEKAADGITTFAGSMRFIYLHSAWFGIWIIINLGALGAGLKFDKFPFGLLTMIVSLEAIFLSTFVMISQNRQSARADVRAELDYETNLRSEIWSLHIGQKLGIDQGHVEQIVAEAIAEAKRSD